MSHQESGTANLQNLNSNTGPLLPKPILSFKISWGDLIILPLIMVILRFNLQSFQLNITLNMFQIHTPLLLNQSMMTKWTISWNFPTRNMMMIFWMLTSRCFRIDCWSPLLQKLIQNLLCCFKNIEERMLQSQISGHTFLCLSQPRSLWNWLMGTRYMPKKLLLFYDPLLTVPLYIQWYKFIVVQIALPTPSHQVPSNFMLVFKSLHMNLLKIVTLLTFKVILVDHLTRHKKISTFFKSKLSKLTLK